MLVDIHEEFKQIDIKSTSTISGLTTFIKKMFSFKHKIYNQKNTREITHQAIVQDQVPPSPNLQLEKKYWRKNSGSQVNCRSFFHEKKGRC